MSVLGFKFIGLVLGSDKASILGNGDLSGKAVDVTDLGDDASRVDFANAGDGGQSIGNDLKLLRNARAFQKQIVCKPFLFPCKVLNSEESGSGKGLQGFVAVIVRVDLLADASKTKLVRRSQRHPQGRSWGVLDRIS